MVHEEVIKMQRDKALKGEYEDWNRIDNKRVLDEYYSLIKS